MTTIILISTTLLLFVSSLLSLETCEAFTTPGHQRLISINPSSRTCIKYSIKEESSNNESPLNNIPVIKEWLNNSIIRSSIFAASVAFTTLSIQQPAEANTNTISY